MKGKKKYILLRILLLIIFLVGVAVIGLYPSRNSDVTLQIVTDQGTINYVIDKDELNKDQLVSVDIKNCASIQIHEIFMVRKFQSVRIQALTAQQIFYDILETDTLKKEMGDGYVKLTGTGDDLRIDFNDVASEEIYKVSRSFLTERFIFAELWLAACMILLMFVKVLEEKADDKLAKRSNHGPIYEVKRFFRDTKNYWQYTIYSAKADLKAEVANSYLNRLWWLLEPFFSMMVYVIVFGKLMGSSIENYATFIFCALLTWSYFNKTVNYSVKLVRNNKEIVSKVYVPKHVLLLSNMALNFYKLLFSMIVLVAMMVIFRIPVGTGTLWVLPAFATMLMLSFGVGMIFLHFGVYVDDLSYAVGILLNMLMFLSGIFYDVTTGLPNPLNILMLALNPVAMLIDTMRQALIYNRIVNVPLWFVWTIISVLICCIGVHIVYKNENGYVKVV